MHSGIEPVYKNVEIITFCLTNHFFSRCYEAGCLVYFLILETFARASIEKLLISMEDDNA